MSSPLINLRNQIVVKTQIIRFGKVMERHGGRLKVLFSSENESFVWGDFPIGATVFVVGDQAVGRLSSRAIAVRTIV